MLMMMLMFMMRIVVVEVVQIVANWRPQVMDRLRPMAEKGCDD